MDNDFVSKQKKGIYLSNNDISILKKYEIDYMKYSNMKELIFEIEDILNNEYTEPDLEELSIKLDTTNKTANKLVKKVFLKSLSIILLSIII